MTTNTFSVIPTITLKKGSGAGNYTYNSTTGYVDVDGTNLAYIVTIPTGWKLAIMATGTAYQATGIVNIAVSLFDGATLCEQVLTPSAINTDTPFALCWSITGDGNSHTVKLQYKTFNTSDLVGMINSSATNLPTMLFILTPSN